MFIVDIKKGTLTSRRQQPLGSCDRQSIPTPILVNVAYRPGNDDSLKTVDLSKSSDVRDRPRARKRWEMEGVTAGLEGRRTGRSETQATRSRPYSSEGHSLQQQRRRAISNGGTRVRRRLASDRGVGGTSEGSDSGSGHKKLIEREHRPRPVISIGPAR